VKNIGNRQDTRIFSTAAVLLGCALCGSVLAQSTGYDRPSRGTDDRSWHLASSIDANDADRRFGADRHGEGVGLRFGKVVWPSSDIQFGPTVTRSRFAVLRMPPPTLDETADPTYTGIEASRLNSTGKGASHPVVGCTDKKRSDSIACLEPNRGVAVEQIVVERRVP
jgi:hypothetical protein